jgi:hypothetical protein
VRQRRTFKKMAASSVLDVENVMETEYGGKDRGKEGELSQKY